MPSVHYDNTTFVVGRAKIRPVLENFVVMELLKQKAWSDVKPNMYHFRTKAGGEVDVVLEGKNKKIIGIEIKSPAS